MAIRVIAQRRVLKIGKNPRQPPILVSPQV